jgi:multiple sugar transport system permease protein
LSASAAQRRTRGRPFSPGRGLLFVSILVLAIIYLFPLYWLLVTSFAPESGRIQDIVPSRFSLDNYARLLAARPIILWVLNSVIVATIGMAGAVFTSTLAGYVFAKKTFRGRELLFWLVIATMTLPFATLLVPLFLVMRDLGWISTYQGMFAPIWAFPFGVFLVRQFMHTIPNDLLDAAKVDGASDIQMLWRIVVPLAKPAIAAVAIFAFLGTWNDYVWQLVIINNDKLNTLPVGTAAIITSNTGGVSYGLATTAAAISFVPMLIIFLLFQSYFVRGIGAGALKG